MGTSVAAATAPGLAVGPAHLRCLVRICLVKEGNWGRASAAKGEGYSRKGQRRALGQNMQSIVSFPVAAAQIATNCVASNNRNVSATVVETRVRN